MLLQGLNSFTISAGGKFDAAEVVGTLTMQLSENAADGDRLTEELLRIADQRAQLTKVQDGHWASALAVALRKLHKSYAKRTKELVVAKEQITRLEGELEDAWQEAEMIAKEMRALLVVIMRMRSTPRWQRSSPSIGNFVWRKQIPAPFQTRLPLERL